MKVLILNGSPRVGGNTSIAVDDNRVDEGGYGTIEQTR